MDKEIRCPNCGCNFIHLCTDDNIIKAKSTIPITTSHTEQEVDAFKDYLDLLFSIYTIPGLNSCYCCSNCGYRIRKHTAYIVDKCTPLVINSDNWRGSIGSNYDPKEITVAKNIKHMKKVSCPHCDSHALSIAVNTNKIKYISIHGIEITPNDIVGNEWLIEEAIIAEAITKEEPNPETGQLPIPTIESIDCSKCGNVLSLETLKVEE